jgi:replicative DNA helicase
LREAILPSLEETDYEELATASIFRALMTLRKNGAEVSAETLTELTADDALVEDILPVLLMGDAPREADEAIDEVLVEAENCVAALRGMAISKRIVEISQELVLAERKGDAELLNRLVQEQMDLARMKFELERSNFTDASY